MLNDQQQEQFTRLWTEVQPSVAGYINAVVRDPNVSKDLVQETALVLLRKFGEWDSDRKFLPWALGVARFEILAYWRDAGRSRLVFDDELLDAITESWSGVTEEISDEQAMLHECLKKLAPHSRKVVQLRYFEALNAPEIADHLGSTAGAVRISLLRIREKLRICVERHLPSKGGTV